MNGTDLNVIASHFNTARTGYTNGDVNGDGIINGTDLNAVASNFNVQYSTVVPAITSVGLGSAGTASAFGGNAVATAQVGAVPEPTSLGLVLLAGAGMLRRRRVQA